MYIPQKQQTRIYKRLSEYTSETNLAMYNIVYDVFFQWNALFLLSNLYVDW